jgi:glutamate/tyrosine decarboxylase-like PLP-dependent enzyme
VDGIERADSLAFDLHKWMYVQYEIGCVLVRHAKAHFKTFAFTPEYIETVEGGRGLSSGELPWLMNYDYHLSRGFRGLKAWMSIKEHGISKYGRLIQQNVDQCQYLADLVLASPDLELSAPVPLNVVCFRFISSKLDDAQLDELNKQILIELQEEGIAVPSGTIIDGNYVLHVAHTNHRTQRKDFDILVEAVVRIGKEQMEIMFKE